MIPWDEVRCMVCGKTFKSVEASHLATHGMTIEEYEAKFPHSPRVSINTLLKLGRFREAEEMVERWIRGELYYGGDEV